MFKQTSLFIILLTICLIFITQIIIAQTNKKYNIIPKFHPLALISIPRPTVLGGVELKYNKIGVDLAYGQQWSFFMSSEPDTNRVNNFGNRYRINLKYYFNTSKLDLNATPFISVGYCKIYTIQNYTTHWFSGYKFDSSLAIIDNINVFSISYGISIIQNKLIYEGVLGSGVRLRTQQYINSDGNIYDEASQTLPHLSFAVRVGYLF